MAQFARPDADTDAASWTTTPLWSKVDEADATGDGVEITSDAVGNGVNTTIAILRLSDVTDPEVSTGHIMRMRWRVSTTKTMAGQLRLRQGTTNIALIEVNHGTTTEIESSYTLSAAEANSITDYSDLNFQIWGTGAGGGPTRSMIVDKVEFEVPDAPALDPGTFMQRYEHMPSPNPLLRM